MVELLARRLVRDVEEPARREALPERLEGLLRHGVFVAQEAEVRLLEELLGSPAELVEVDYADLAAVRPQDRDRRGIDEERVHRVRGNVLLELILPDLIAFVLLAEPASFGLHLAHDPEHVVFRLRVLPAERDVWEAGGSGLSDPDVAHGVAEQV